MSHSDRVVFETATIADALNKAARVAPSIKSIGSDDGAMRIAGINIQYSEYHNAVYISSTDLDIRYSQQVTPLEISGSGEWRVPVQVAKYIDTLPKSRGSTVEMSAPSGLLQIVRAHRNGESRGEYALISGAPFPSWDAYDETGAEAVGSLASKLESVAWATGDDDAVPEFGGIYLDGYYAMATDRYVAARIPLSIPSLVNNGITVPADKLIGIVRQAGDALVTRIESGLGVTPDDFTQIEVNKLAENKCDRLSNMLPANTDFNASATIDVAEFNEVRERISKSLKKGDDTRLTLMVTRDKMLFTIGDGVSGKVTDAIGIKGGPELPTSITFNNEKIGNVIGKAIGQTAVFCFNQGEKKQPKFPYVMGGAGYEAWCSPVLGGDNA